MSRSVIRPGASLVQDGVYEQHSLPTGRPIVQYIRQSTARQLKRNKQSFEMQDSDLKRNLVRAGWKEGDIIRIATDQGKSGTKRRDERKGLDELYKSLETGAAAAIAAFDVSRLYRVTSKAEIGKFCDMVLELGVPVVTFSRIYWPTKTDNDQLEADLRAAGAFIEEIVKGKLLAAKNRHIQYDGSYGGGWLPFGYLVDDMHDDSAEKKSYRIYEPHAKLVRWLFKRFRELGGNVPRFARDLVETDFCFPPFEQGIVPHVALRPREDGSYPVRTRDAIISILTNRAYIGHYTYGGVLVSTEAHKPIVCLEDFLYAYERLSNVSLDGSEKRKRVQRERRYGDTSALLEGVVKSELGPVYVVDDSYVVRVIKDGFARDELTVSMVDLDAAFAKAMVASLARLEQARRNGLKNSLHEQVAALQREQERLIRDYDKTLARIDKEIRGQEMAQRVSREEGDEQGYRTATKQLVQLRKDKAAIDAKSSQADGEVKELAECYGLIDCATSQWESMPIPKRKRLVKMLVTSANLVEASPHFVRLDVVLTEPVNLSLSLYLYRVHGSRQTWNEHEEEVLRELYPTASRQAVMEALPLHTWTAITRHAVRLGVRRAATADSSDTISKVLAQADYKLMQQEGACTGKPVWAVHEDADVSQQVCVPCATGALLHDIGKLEELEEQVGVGYTPIGRMVGHIVLGMQFVREKACQVAGLDAALIDDLLHIILAHHTKEFGSPVNPATTEALIVHKADATEAQLTGFLDHCRRTSGPDGWTTYSSHHGGQLRLP